MWQRRPLDWCLHGVLKPRDKGAWEVQAASPVRPQQSSTQVITGCVVRQTKTPRCCPQKKRWQPVAICPGSGTPLLSLRIGSSHIPLKEIGEAQEAGAALFTSAGFLYRWKCLLQRQLFKTIPVFLNMPKRYILGWHILVPHSVKTHICTCRNGTVSL